jgi:hypothetical protein
LLPTKWVSNTAEMSADSHDDYYGFCPAMSQLYRAVVKLPHRKSGNTVILALGRWPVTG